MLRQREARLLVGALFVGAAALFTLHANLGSTDSSTVVQFMLVVTVAVLAHVAIRRFAPLADPLLLPTGVLLNLLGLTMIHRLDIADAQRAIRQGVVVPDGSFDTQTAWSVLGLSLLVATLLIIREARVLPRYTYTSMVVGLVLLLMPLLPVVGATVNGARLWVRFGSYSFQPGEFAKIFLAIFFAGYLVLKRNSLALIRIQRWGLGFPRARDLGPIVVCWIVSVAILVFERDLGMSLLFFGLFVSMLFFATGHRTWLMLGAMLFVVSATSAFLAFDHVQTRVLIWLHPFSYADTSGYQVVQSLYGLASGGLFGSGLGAGFPGLVPFAKSDFILSALGEELGLVGFTAILMLYALLVQRGFRMAMRSQDGFGQLLAGGLALAIGLQTFVVAGGVTRLIPLTGLTTPLLSAGGSSLTAMWISIALLLRISDETNRRAEVSQ